MKCPICKKETTWENNDNRPFCSERCKMIDLGHWADGGYHIEGGPQPDLEQGEKGQNPTTQNSNNEESY